MQVIFVQGNLLVVSRGQITDSIYPGRKDPAYIWDPDVDRSGVAACTGILGWLKKEPDLSQPRCPWLPDPNEADSCNGRAFVAAIKR